MPQHYSGGAKSDFALRTSGGRFTALFPRTRHAELRYSAAKEPGLDRFQIAWKHSTLSTAQFFGPQSVDGNITSGTSGQAVSAAALGWCRPP